MLQKSNHIPSQLLKEYNLSQTKIREEIINVLMQSDVALSSPEITEKMKMNCDRVTLYRNLKTLVEKGIAHQIFVNNHESRYVLPERDIHTGRHNTDHIHFKCLSCSVVQCLHDSLVEPLNLPDGFTKLETNYVVFGFCKTCNANNSKFKTH